MSVEIPEMDIDQRGGKLMKFHWPTANCTVLHNQINVLSASFPHSPLSGGLLKLKLVPVFEIRKVGEHLKTLTGVWETVRIPRIVCESVWSGRAKDDEPLCIPPATSEGMYEIRDSVMWKIHRCFCVCFHSLTETFCIQAVDMLPLCSLTKVIGWKYRIQFVWIFSSVLNRTNVLDNDIWCTWKMMPVYTGYRTSLFLMFSKL